MHNWQHVLQVLALLSALTYGIHGLVVTAADIIKGADIEIRLPKLQKTKNLAISLAAEQDPEFKYDVLERTGAA